METSITPRSFILSALRVVKGLKLTIKHIVAAGELFGFTANTMRVTVSRLVQEGKIEKDERGLYRLNIRVSPMFTFAEGWRAGGSRIKAWDGFWICCLLPNCSAIQRKTNNKALNLFGFKCGLPGLWVRPNNLNLELAHIKNVLTRLRINGRFELFAAKDFDEGLIRQWKADLWPVAELIQACRTITAKLEKSYERMDSLPLDKALVETYMLGSEAVSCLLTDPLLPEDMMSGRYRVALTKMMKKYDRAGKRLWAQKLSGFIIDETPSHLSLEGK